MQVIPPIKNDIAHEFFLPKQGTLTTIATTKIVGNSPKTDKVIVHKSY